MAASLASVPDVWADDAVAMAAITRNRVIHAACIPVATVPAPIARKLSPVGLVIDDDKGTMAAHQPLTRREWELALAEGFQPPTRAGNLPTFAVSISSNERSERIVAAAAFLRSSGVAETCVCIEGREASEEELQRVHSGDHVQKMLLIGKRAGLCVETAASARAILEASTAFNTVFMNQHSVDAARFAAGSTIEAVKSVATGKTSAAVCVVRPPGHHAECGCAMGFGIFNSVAVAAAHAVAAVAEGGLGLKRVLVVDWDIHHGNGTQEIFAEDERVLYFSAHGYYRYPAFSTDGWEQQAGPGFVGGATAAAAAGKTVNCAWTGEGYGDAEYLALWKRVLMPVAREFAPELVIISAGFDSAAGDEEGYQVTPRGYAQMTSQLQSLKSIGGKVVVVLEGGYNIPAISHGLHACVAALSGQLAESATDQQQGQQDCSGEWVQSGISGAGRGDQAGEGCMEEASADIERTVEAQRLYWECLR